MCILIFIDTDRIWENPYPGMVRLAGSNFVNQGRVEVYCNGVWGTVCGNGFSSKDRLTICRQLGYNSANSSNVSTIRYRKTMSTFIVLYSTIVKGRPILYRC